MKEQPEERAKVAPPLVCSIPLQAPSMNALYSMYCRGRVPKVELKGEVRLFKTKLMQLLPRWDCPPHGWLSVLLTFQQPWHYQNGKPKRQDMPNLLKVVLDGLQDRYGFDDSRVAELTCGKVESSHVGIAIRIEALDSALAMALS